MRTQPTSRSTSSVDFNLLNNLTVIVPEGIQPGRESLTQDSGKLYSPFMLTLLLNTCVSGWAKASYDFCSPLTHLHIYNHGSDCAMLKWGLNTLSWIIGNKLNFPVGFASLKNFSMFQEPSFPLSLSGFVVSVGHSGGKGKDLLPLVALHCHLELSAPSYPFPQGSQKQSSRSFLQMWWAESINSAEVHGLQRWEAEAEHVSRCTGCSITDTNLIHCSIRNVCFGDGEGWRLFLETLFHKKY